MRIAIQPVSIWPSEAVFLAVNGVSVALDSGASISVQLQDAEGGVLKDFTNCLTKEQYDAWGSDDSWVLECVCHNLGLTIKE